MGLAEEDYNNLLIDYTASVEDVFSSCVQTMIKSSKSLNILGATCRKEKPAHIKRSWTPDWTQNVTHNPRSVIPTSFSQSTKQHASLDADCMFSFAADLSTLTICGFSLGAIGSIPPLWEMLNFDSASLFEDRVRTAVSTLAQSLDTSKYSPWDALASYLIADSLYWEEGEDIPSEMADINKRKAWSMKLEQWIDSSHSAYFLKPEMFFLGFGYEQDVTEEVDDGMVVKALRGMVCNPGDRDTMFIAENGHIGNCNLHVGDFAERTTPTLKTRVGDLLCIVFGCANPLILRPVGNGLFQLVSEAWVPSIMYGEAMEEMNLGKWEVQDFQLC